MKRRFLFLAMIMLMGLASVQAQTKIKDGTVSGTSVLPSSNAILELESTQKGLLLPRMTTAQRNAIASPATGLVIYNTDEQCLDQYNGTSWTSQCGTTVVNNNTIKNITKPSNGALVFNTDNESFEYFDSATQTWQSIAVPAMTTVQRNAIINPNIGQTIFNTDV